MHADLRLTVGAYAVPSDEQILNLTTRLWQGPPRRVFSPESFKGRNAWAIMTSVVW